MKQSRKVLSYVLTGLLVITFIVTPLSIPRIPPLQERAEVPVESTLV